MRHPSKRHAAVVAKTQQRDSRFAELQEAVRAGQGAQAKAVQLAEAEAELAEAEALSDEYTCPQCGQDFAPDNHVEIFAASIIAHKARTHSNTTGEELPAPLPLRLDFGVADGRRVMICGTCHADWAIPIHQYVNMR